MKKKKVTISAEQPYSGKTGNHYGMPITQVAGILMKYAFRDQVITPSKPETPFHNLAWVEFSKASIFRILAQEGCEFVRFYFAIPNAGSNQASLSLEGIGSDKAPIKQDTITNITLELDKQIAANKIDENAILSKLDVHTIPLNEEKGNGGNPLRGSESVKFMSDFILNNKELGTLKVSDFIKMFYKYAAEKM